MLAFAGSGQPENPEGLNENDPGSNAAGIDCLCGSGHGNHPLPFLSCLSGSGGTYSRWAGFRQLQSVGKIFKTIRCLVLTLAKNYPNLLTHQRHLKI